MLVWPCPALTTAVCPVFSLDSISNSWAGRSMCLCAFGGLRGTTSHRVHICTDRNWGEWGGCTLCVGVSTCVNCSWASSWTKSRRGLGAKSGQTLERPRGLTVGYQRNREVPATGEPLRCKDQLLVGYKSAPVPERPICMCVSMPEATGTWGGLGVSHCIHWVSKDTGRFHSVHVCAGAGLSTSNWQGATSCTASSTCWQLQRPQGPVTAQTECHRPATGTSIL